MGETVNLMSVDALRFRQIVFNINTVQNTLIIVCLSTYSLWGYLGPSCLAGIGVMVALVPLLAVCVAINRRQQKRMMEVKDQRMRVISEVVDGVKVIKFNAWEEAFAKRITEIRNQELRSLLSSA